MILLLKKTNYYPLKVDYLKRKRKTVYFRISYQDMSTYFHNLVKGIPDIILNKLQVFMTEVSGPPLF